MHKNIIKASNLKRNEYINHLERCFYFLNILFRIENTFINLTAKEDLDSVSINIKNNINNIFRQFNYEEIINQYKKLILVFLEIQQKNFKKLIKEYNDDLEKLIKYINLRIKNLINELKDILEENLINVKKEISKELEKIGISDNINYANIELSLGQKILIGAIVVPCTLIALPFALAYGVLYKLPSSFIKSLINLFKQKEKQFNDYLKTLKEEINDMMKGYLAYYTVEIIKYENCVNEIIKRFLGLIEASYIKADDSYNEAKENYLKIYEDYKKIKNIK